MGNLLSADISHGLSQLDVHTLQVLMETLFDEEEIKAFCNIEDDEEDLLFDTADLAEKVQYWYRSRLKWEEHVYKSLHEKSFHAKYRMSYECFKLLISILAPFLHRDITKSRRVLNSEELRICLPSTNEEIENVARGFTEISTCDIHNGRVVGAVDGFFQSCKCPTMAESNFNPGAYYSGHYQDYGLNVQAMCDAKLRFLFFAVAAPGKTNDSVSITFCNDLLNYINGLDLGKYVVGDAAYDLSDRLLIPFTGSQRANNDKDAFNFFLSQLRIRIEMAFARLVRKWWILTSTLQNSLETNSKILMACARLHNFVIDNDKKVKDIWASEDDESLSSGSHVSTNAPFDLAYMPTIPEEFESPVGSSILRQALVDLIHQNSLQSPHHNRVRQERYKLLQENLDADMIDLEYFSPSV
ncbi:hypothetical protein CTEN210_08403 [Chaetoceros tenuissimus]|uniref:DDE Tnp4 domain-containing protein n=1 Tax=Chaetoceros tenuissimus TaxID=426638 RepID=A0AAD3CTG9_9STRA|nr:hypothetical protein CTEN210_08403 [Chaetoceros tenuissimus]